MDAEPHLEDPQLFISTVTQCLIGFSENKGTSRFFAPIQGWMEDDQVVQLKGTMFESSRKKATVDPLERLFGWQSTLPS
jgi:hypothetical protein